MAGPSGPANPYEYVHHVFLTTYLSSVKLKNSWNCASLPQSYVFVAWCLIRHRETFPLAETAVTVVRNLTAVTCVFRVTE
jgi:hypothetical protein